MTFDGTNLEAGLVQHVGRLDLLLQFHLLLLLLVVLHDLEALLLHQTSLLNVELLLGLGVDLLGFFGRLLLDEGHHVLDLLRVRRDWRNGLGGDGV